MLAIDTSAALSAVALVDGERVVGEVEKPSRLSPTLWGSAGRRPGRGGTTEQ
jgi:hypothetical protein